MARRIAANLFMTLDERGEFVPYPGWDRPSSEPNDHWSRMARFKGEKGATDVPISWIYNCPEDPVMVSGPARARAVTATGENGATHLEGRRPTKARGSE